VQDQTAALPGHRSAGWGLAHDPDVASGRQRPGRDRRDQAYRTRQDPRQNEGRSACSSTT